MADLPDRVAEPNSPDAEPATRVVFSDTQLDTIARMLVAGVPPHEIAAAFGVRVQRIHDLDRRNPDMQSRKARFAGDITRRVVMQKFRMFEKLDTALDVMEADGLRAPDARTRIDAAKWWIANTVPPLEQRHAVTVQFPEELVDAVRHLAQNDAALREVQSTKRPLLSRIRTSLAELPSPVPEEPPSDDSNAA